MALWSPKESNTKSGNSGVGTLLALMAAQNFRKNSAKSAEQVNEQYPSGIAPVGSRLDKQGGVDVELNRPLPEAAESTMRLGRTQAVNLGKNVNQLIGSKNLQKRTSPFNLSAHSGFIGNTALQLEGLMNTSDVSEFASFKSGTEQLFQQYRKYITGVQAGFPELQMLQPIFPVSTDPPSNYISKAVQALETMKTNEDTLIDYEKKRGYQMGELEGTFPVDPSEFVTSAQQAGINVSPIPGMNQDDPKTRFLKRKGLA
ncbi:hypothetical protein KKH13_05195 [Patescibacteria group bacterium]|nr:hypothetical protein [Patescibacteria group bacterium]